MATRLPQSFGELLRTYRTAAGLTQEELAARAGMSARGISDLERGVRRTPYRGTVELLAQALQLAAPERTALSNAASQRARSSASFVGRETQARTKLSTLVGRKDELALLQQLLEGAGPALILLTGEPGIGKTRLLREAALRASEAAWTVLEGSCARPGGQTLYAPILEALEGRMRAQTQASLRIELEGCTWLVRLLPELAEQGLLPLPGMQLSAEQERRLLFASVARYLNTIAGPAGTLLLLDDLQWAGSDALDLLVLLIRTVPVLRVVGAYRSTEIPPDSPLVTFIADVVRDDLLKQLELGPLPSEEAGALFRATLEGRPEHEGVLIESVLERAGGVPFFLVSCARALEAGTLVSEARVLPWDVQQIIRQRVAALPEAAQELLWVAAIVGRSIPEEVLLAASTCSEHEVLAAVDALCQARLLIEDGGSYQFAHDLIREGVEADVSQARRRSLHRRVAKAWEQAVASCPPEVLAYHYGQAGELALALKHLLQAVERARAVGAHRQAVRLLEQALTFARQTGQFQLLLDLHIQRGNALRDAALWSEAETELLGVLQGLSAAQERQRIEVLLTLADIRHWLLDVPGMRLAAEEAYRHADQPGRDDLAARAMMALAQAESSDGETQRSLSHVRRALSRVGKTQPAELAPGLLLASMLQYWSGHFQDAVQSSRQAISLAQQAYDTSSMTQALGNLGLALSGKGRYAEAFETFAEARRVAHERGTGQWLARALVMCGGVHLELFDFAGAEMLALEARELSRSLHWPQAETSAGIDLLLNFARRGEVGLTEDLVKKVAEAVAGAQGAHGWLWRLRFATARGEIALARSSWEEAAHLGEQVIVQSRRTGRVKYQARGLEIRAQALAAQGQTHEARALLRNAVDLVKATEDPALLLRATTALLHLAADETLFAQAQAHAQTIVHGLRDEELIRRFLAAEEVRHLLPFTKKSGS